LHPRWPWSQCCILVQQRLCYIARCLWHVTWRNLICQFSLRSSDPKGRQPFIWGFHSASTFVWVPNRLLGLLVRMDSRMWTKIRLLCFTILNPIEASNARAILYFRCGFCTHTIVATNAWTPGNLTEVSRAASGIPLLHTRSPGLRDCWCTTSCCTRGANLTNRRFPRGLQEEESLMQISLQPLVQLRMGCSDHPIGSVHNCLKQKKNRHTFVIRTRHDECGGFKPEIL
jgi:hypothetical protein